MKTSRLWKVSALLCGLACVWACDSVPDHPPTLGELKIGDAVKPSGKWLMSVPPGLFRLDAPPRDAKEAIVAVHGYESRGYEWIQPLKTLGAEGAQVYFYRWDWTQCPAEGASGLTRVLEGLTERHAKLEKFRLYGHSYGGVISALVAQDYKLPVPIEVHIIASPLKGHPRLTERCGYSPPSAPGSDKVQVHQWRTIKAQDGAFKDMEVDPQEVDIAGSTVTRLPEVWNGRRLGHNWSISWVAEHRGSTKGKPDP